MTPVVCGMDAQVLSEQQNSFSSMLSVGLGWGLGRFSPGRMAVDASVRCRLLPQCSWDKRRTHLPDGSEVSGGRSAARAGQRPRPQPWPFLEAGQRYKPAPVLPVPPSLTLSPVTAAVFGGIARAGRAADPQQHSPHKQSGDTGTPVLRDRPWARLGCSSDSPDRQVRKRL